MKVDSFRARDLLLGGRTPFSAIHHCAGRGIKDRVLVTELTVMCQVGRSVHLGKKFLTENPESFLSPCGAEPLNHSEAPPLGSQLAPLPLYSKLTAFEPGLTAVPNIGGCPQGVTAVS